MLIKKDKETHCVDIEMTQIKTTDRENEVWLNYNCYDYNDYVFLPFEEPSAFSYTNQKEKNAIKRITYNE